MRHCSVCPKLQKNDHNGARGSPAIHNFEQAKAVWLQEVQFWHLQQSEFICRRVIHQHTLREGKILHLSHREAIGRQRLVQACGEGVEGLYGLARQTTLAICQAQLVSRESVRRQMLNFAYHRELGPMHRAFNPILGFTMQPGETNQTAPWTQPNQLIAQVPKTTIAT